MPKTPRSASYDFRTLLTHRILVLSNTLGKGAARLYAKRYGVLLAEWRLLAALMIEGPSSVNGLARALGTDKGWISRTAAGLVEKGYAAARAEPGDARRFRLEVTAAGRTLYGKILPAAVERQSRLVAVFSDKERRLLDDLLARLLREAEKLTRDADEQDDKPVRSAARSAAKKGAVRER